MQATKLFEGEAPPADHAKYDEWVAASDAVARLSAACATRAIQLSLTSEQREEHWQANRLVAKGVGRTDHLEHLDPKKRLQGAFAAVLATGRINRMLNAGNAPSH